MPEWKPLSEQEVKEWRKSLGKGFTREVATGRREGLERVEADGDTATVERPSPSSVREPRETVEAVAKQMMDWARGDRETFKERIRFLKAAHPDALGHLSDEEAGEQLWSLLQKVVRSAAERNYRSKGWDKGTVIYGNTDKPG